MAGVDVELAPPVYVPLLRRAVRLPGPRLRRRRTSSASCRDVLSARLAARRRRGFFHPDRFTFGQPLFVSDVVAAAMAVPGVAWVDVTAFARLAIPPSATAARPRGRRDRRRGPRGAALRQRPEQPRGRPGRDRDRGDGVTSRRAARSAGRRSTRPRTRPASPPCTGGPRRTRRAGPHARALAAPGHDLALRSAGRRRDRRAGGRAARRVGGRRRHRVLLLRADRPGGLPAHGHRARVGPRARPHARLRAAPRRRRPGRAGVHGGDRAGRARGDHRAGRDAGADRARARTSCRRPSRPRRTSRSAPAWNAHRPRSTPGRRRSRSA